MVIYHNALEDGKKQSITRFEPLDPHRPVYKRPFLGKQAARQLL